jgi:hypothetical protein
VVSPKGPHIGLQGLDSLQLTLDRRRRCPHNRRIYHHLSLTARQRVHLEDSGQLVLEV